MSTEENFHCRPDSDQPTQPTPRTDARIGLDADGDPVVTADFARQLEQELAAAKQEVEEARKTIMNMQVTALKKHVASGRIFGDDKGKIAGLPDVDYSVDTPRTRAFMTQIDDTEVDLSQVESHSKDLECELIAALARLTALPSKPEATATEWAEQAAKVGHWGLAAVKAIERADKAEEAKRFAQEECMRWAKECDQLLAQLTALRHHAAQQGGEDSMRLDWLAERLCYVMLSNGTAMHSLPNRGRGWTNGELRAAIDAAMKQEGK